MVVDVAKVGPQILVDQLRMQAGELQADVFHRLHRVAQFHQLALLGVKIFEGGVIELAGEYPRFKIAKIVGQGRDDGVVIVDDEIHQGVERIRRALFQHVILFLATAPHRRVALGIAVTHRDQKIVAHEEVGFAVANNSAIIIEVGLGPGVIEGLPALRGEQFGGLDDDEQRLAVAFDLGALVGLAGILHRQIVEAEFLLNLQ